YNARLDVRRRAILVDPIKQELRADGELSAGVAEEGCVRVEGGTHQFAFALLAPIDIHLHGLDDLVVLREIFAFHAETIALKLAGRQRINAVKVGQPSDDQRNIDMSSDMSSQTGSNVARRLGS